MAVIPIPLVAPQQLTSAALGYYLSSNITTRIDKATFTNTDMSAHTVTVYIVAQGGSPGNANTIVLSQSIAAGEVWNAPHLIGHVMPLNSSLYMKADANSVVTVMVSGVTIGSPT